MKWAVIKLAAIQLASHSKKVKFSKHASKLQYSVFTLNNRVFYLNNLVFYLNNLVFSLNIGTQSHHSALVFVQSLALKIKN